MGCLTYILNSSLPDGDTRSICCMATSPHCSFQKTLHSLPTKIHGSLSKVRHIASKKEAREAAEEAAERRAQQPSLVGRPPAACELKFLRWDLFPAWAPGAETGLSFLRVPWVSLADSRLTSESLECSENIPNAYPANMPFNVLQSRSGH